MKASKTLIALGCLALSGAGYREVQKQAAEAEWKEFNSVCHPHFEQEVAQVRKNIEERLKYTPFLSTEEVVASPEGMTGLVKENRERCWGAWETKGQSLAIARVIQEKACTSFKPNPEEEKKQKEARRAYYKNTRPEDRVLHSGSSELGVYKTLPNEPFVNLGYPHLILEQVKKAKPDLGEANLLPSPEFFRGTEQLVDAQCTQRALKDWFEMNEKAQERRQDPGTYMKHTYQYYAGSLFQLPENDYSSLESSPRERVSIWLDTWSATNKKAGNSPYYNIYDPKKRNEDPYFESWDKNWKKSAKLMTERFFDIAKPEEKKIFDRFNPYHVLVKQFELSLSIPWRLLERIQASLKDAGVSEAEFGLDRKAIMEATRKSYEQRSFFFEGKKRKHRRFNRDNVLFGVSAQRFMEAAKAGQLPEEL